MVDYLLFNDIWLLKKYTINHKLIVVNIVKKKYREAVFCESN